MTSVRLLSLTAAFVAGLYLSACDGAEPVAFQTLKANSATLSISGLDLLPPSHTYELWLKDNGTLKSLGRFRQSGSQSEPLSLSIPLTRLRAGMELELSIEPVSGDDPGQSQQVLLSGFMENNSSSSMSVERAMAFIPWQTRIQYILETPSTEAEDDYKQGLYWCVPGSFFGLPDPVIPIPQPDVVPVLPDGFVYEGWVVEEDGTAVSTGRFPEVGVPDTDSNGPAAGPLPALPFPGQEYINPPKELPGMGLMLSIEPEPDYSAAPSGIILLQRDEIADEGPVTQQHMSGGEGDSGPMPTVFVSFSSRKI